MNCFAQPLPPHSRQERSAHLTAALFDRPGALVVLLDVLRQEDIAALSATRKGVRHACARAHAGYWQNRLRADFGVERDAADFLHFVQQPPAFVQVCAGTYCSAGVLANGHVVEWGHKRRGNATGAMDALPHGRRYVQVSVGANHALGLLDNGDVVGWGRDDSGQVSGARLALPPGRRYVQVSAGLCHSLGVLDNGQLVEWGLKSCRWSVRGEPWRSATQRYVYAKSCGTHLVAVLDDGRVLEQGCDDSARLTDYELPPGRRFVQVCAGDRYSLGLLDNGELVARGEDRWGAASGGANALPAGRHYVQVAAGVCHSVGLLDNGEVVAWGRNWCDEVRGAGAAVPPGRHCVQVSAESQYSLALLDNGHVVGWGADTHRRATGGMEARREYMMRALATQLGETQ